VFQTPEGAGMATNNPVFKAALTCRADRAPDPFTFGELCAATWDRFRAFLPDDHGRFVIDRGKEQSDQQALRLQPNYPEARNNLGIVLARPGRLDVAAACSQQALRLSPKSPEAHNNLGLVLANEPHNSQNAPEEKSR
jgi:lipoprotein NlpI